MTDTPQHAGHVAGRHDWPADPRWLTDTTLCPACFRRLPGPYCPACGLDLRGPRAAELLAASAALATAEDARQLLINTMRQEQAAALPPTAQQPVAPQPTAPQPTAPYASAQLPTAQLPTSPLPTSPLPTSQLPTAPNASVQPSAAPHAAAPHAPWPHGTAPAEPPSPARTAAEPKGRTRSSVQVALLIVGVCLVSIAAIFFLTVAWLVTGLAVRSVIVAALTLTALAVAGVLRRKRLAATAEGIGVVAVVLVLLDTWAIRGNDVFDAARVGGLIYWGAGLLLCAALFLVWHALSRLHVGSIVGLILVAPASGMLVAGLSAPLDGATRSLFAALATAVATLAYLATVPPSPSARQRVPWWPRRNRSLERIVLFVFLIGALAWAALASWGVGPSNVTAPLWCAGLIVAVGAVHVAVMLNMRRSSATSPAATAPATIIPAAAIPATVAGVAAFMVAAVGIQLAARLHDEIFAVTVSTAIAAAVALMLEALARRRAVGALRSVLTAAAVTAAAVAGCQLLATTAVAAVPAVRALAAAFNAEEHGARPPQPIEWWALLAVAAVTALVAAAWGLQGILRSRSRWLAWGCSVVLLCAIAFTTAPVSVVVGYSLTAVLSLVVLLRRSNATQSPRRLRPVLLSVMIAATTFSYLCSTGHPALWWIGSLVAVTVAFCSRYLVRGPARATGRAVLLPVTALLLVVAAATAAWMLALGRHPAGAAVSVNVLGAVAGAAALLHVVLALPWRRGLRPRELRSTFWTLLCAVPVFIVLPFTTGGVAGDPGLLIAEPFGSVLRETILLGAVLLWLTVGRRRLGLRTERTAAISALAPVLALACWDLTSLVSGTAPSGFAQMAVIAAAALVVCGSALAFHAGTGRAHERVALESGAAVTFCWAGVLAITTGPDAIWLWLLLAALGLLLAAIASDGLFASVSPRRHLGWAALGFGVAALWVRLAQSGVDAVEPFVLPVGAALLILAGLVAKFGAARPGRGRVVAPTLVLAALTVMLVPLALQPIQTGAARAAIVGAASAALLLTASAPRWSSRSAALLAACALPGAVGVVLVTVQRILQLGVANDRASWPFEMWLWSACAVLVTAGFLLVRGGTPIAGRLLSRAASITVAVALVLLTIGEHMAAAHGQAPVHLTLVVCILAAAHVVAFWRRTAPVTVTVGWFAVTLAALVILLDAARLAPIPLELVTVPVAVALLVSGWLQLAHAPTARSWPWLGPGVALLLVPSLVIGFTDAALWRIVALGILAIGVLLAGLLLRLQAPFLLGCAVVLVHAMVQLWPWIAAAYAATQWWMWIGAGGVILIVLAARYEQRIRDLRAIVVKVSALR